MTIASNRIAWQWSAPGEWSIFLENQRLQIYNFSLLRIPKKIFFPPKSANGVHNTFVISRNRLIVSSEIAAPGNFRRQKLRSRGTRRRNVLAISSIDKCGLMLLCLVGFVDYIPVGLWVKYWNQAAATKDESIELNENYFDPQSGAHPCWKICVCVGDFSRCCACPPTDFVLVIVASDSNHASDI